MNRNTWIIIIVAVVVIIGLIFIFNRGTPDAGQPGRPVELRGRELERPAVSRRLAPSSSAAFGVLGGAVVRRVVVAPKPASGAFVRCRRPCRAQ